MAAGVTFPHPSLRVRWWGVVTAAVFLPAFLLSQPEAYPLTIVLGFAWALWRHDRDHGRH